MFYSYICCAPLGVVDDPGNPPCGPGTLGVWLTGPPGVTPPPTIVVLALRIWGVTSPYDTYCCIYIWAAGPLRARPPAGAIDFLGEDAAAGTKSFYPILRAAYDYR